MKKVGLVFDDETIEISDEERLTEVAMTNRAEFCLPSCTNQLENTHDHLNSAIPRRNIFWQSIKRLIEALIKKNYRFKLYFKHNYSYFKSKINKIASRTSISIMDNSL